MSQNEKYNYRDEVYSKFHRPNSLIRFMTARQAELLSSVDLDTLLWIEYEGEENEGDRTPLMLIETAIDIGQLRKAATVLIKLAQMAGVVMYIILYDLSGTPNPAEPRVSDIRQFRVRRCWPDPETDWTVMTPQQWCDKLLEVRAKYAAQLGEALRKSKESVPRPSLAKTLLSVMPFIVGGVGGFLLALAAKG